MTEKYNSKELELNEKVIKLIQDLAAKQAEWKRKEEYLNEDIS